MLSAASAAPPPSAMRPAQLTFVRRRSDGRRPFGSEHRTRSSSAWCRPSCRARSDSRWAARRRHGSRRRRRRRHRCRRGNCFQLHALDQAKAVLTLVETAADKSLQTRACSAPSRSPQAALFATAAAGANAAAARLRRHAVAHVHVHVHAHVHSCCVGCGDFVLVVMVYSHLLCVI